MQKSKILLTGGHAATTAVAVVEELIRRTAEKGNLEIYWVGARWATEGKKIPTIESQIFPKIGLKSFLIVSGRLQRKFTVWTIPSLFKIPIGLFQAFWLLLKIRPSLVVSFGGFVSFPVVLAAWFLRIPVVIHEQTSVAGLANRLSQPFAKKILLTRNFSQNYFNPEKSEVVGNPVMTQITEINSKEKIGSPPTILITSGSRGSQILNETISKALKILLKKYKVIHLTGEFDFKKFETVKDSNYEVYGRIDPMQIDNLYRQADIIISRAGANTVSEIMVAKRPAILIPIPWSYLDEQTKNAEFARDWGIVRIIPQDELTPERLLKEIEILISNYSEIVKKVAQKVSPDLTAAKKLVDVLEKFIRK